MNVLMPLALNLTASTVQIKDPLSVKSAQKALISQMTISALTVTQALMKWYARFVIIKILTDA